MSVMQALDIVLRLIMSLVLLGVVALGGAITLRVLLEYLFRRRDRR